MLRMYCRRTTVLLICLATCVVNSALLANDPLPTDTTTPTEQGIVPLSLYDPAFTQHVDMQTLTDGYAWLDAAKLADAALQLAEGERVLFRSHRAVTAEEMFGLALDAATESRDLVTIDRLERAFARNGRAQLAGRLKEARLLAGTSRAPNPVTMVDVTTTDTDAFRLFTACQRDVKAAQMTSDARVLGALQEAIPLMPLLTGEQQEYLLDQVRSPIPDRGGTGPSLGGRLRLLQAASRCDPSSRTGCYQPSWDELERLAGTSREPEVRQQAAAAFEKLRAVSRFCDIMAGVDCF